ncbi:inositol monophosphatase family protein [Labrys monachus]|uniref:Myo-inositol-1(Or 4)-monophosphatase n=1 Tax=Labrys monachus TaxID=217067 RepID=A0ABU0FGQ3_9HYPH|nr:inositol monophosphatase [Labrys monachus]MDQ0393784.1 myo-inositol-1(or 4)-monophosphatase [Labrys monachus]
MSTDPIYQRYSLAHGIVKEAGALALGYFNRLETLTVKSKGLQDLVSEADLQTELLISRRIAESYPEDAFFGEETGATGLQGARGVWVVDPIDGTQPFLSGQSCWCVSIAFLFDGELQFGLVYSPKEDELFVGGLQAPATLNGRIIHPQAGARLTDGVVSIGYNNRITPDDLLAVMGRLLHAGGTYQRNGSGALCLCYVACGRLLGYVESHINSWDCLGAIAIIRAAGGRTNDFLANDGLTAGNRIAAAGPNAYEAVAALLG